MVVFKIEGEIEFLNQVNGIVYQVFGEFEFCVVLGVMMCEFDCFVEDFIWFLGGVFVFLNYCGFLVMFCMLINDVIVYGILNDELFVEGDIFGVDCGVVFKGYYGDLVWIFWVGEVSDEVQKLLDVICEVLYFVVVEVWFGGCLGDIGYVVQSFVELQGFLIVWEFVGYGIGMFLYEVLNVLNFGNLG